MARQTFSIRLEGAVLCELDAVAQASSLSRAAVAEQVLKAFLNQGRADQLRHLRSVRGVREGSDA